MTVLGYGEDALTLHAITGGLPRVLRQLGDDTDPVKALIFYRPSFGRRSSAPTGSPRSEFGEFDAIIGTTRAVYIVEAKWSASAELTGTDLKLRKEQTKRHLAFRAYLEEWRRDRPADWATFAAQDLRLVPPSAGTTLARNLAYVLGRLDVCGPTIVDVLLFCRVSEATPAPSTCGTFSIVTHMCVPEEGGGFIRLSA